MLLSLSKFLQPHLTIALGSTHIAIVESKKQPTLVSCTSVADWQASLVTLGQWLAQNKRNAAQLGRVGQVDLIVSDEFVRYALIPWSDNVYKKSEVAALSRIHFETLFGDAAANWDIQTEPAVYGQASISCAMDKALLSSLLDLLKAHGLRLASLQPYFVRAFNQWHNRLIGDGVFAVVEADQCVLACYKNSAWHSIRSFKLDEHLEASLERLIEREKLLQGLSETAAIDIHKQANQADALAMFLNGAS